MYICICFLSIRFGDFKSVQLDDSIQFGDSIRERVAIICDTRMRRAAACRRCLLHLSELSRRIELDHRLQIESLSDHRSYIILKIFIIHNICHLSRFLILSNKNICNHFFFKLKLHLNMGSSQNSKFKIRPLPRSIFEF